MESTASPEPTGRDVGPFRGVSTLRVHGGYEVCRGKDDEGRQVTILTMGPSAAKSQPLRDTLVESYEWVRAAGVSNRDAFVGADLTGDQPWIASLDGPGGSDGVRRLFERLVGSVRPPAPGRQTGTLPRVTDSGHIPRVNDAGQVGHVRHAPEHDPHGRYPGKPAGPPPPPAMAPGQYPNGPQTGQIPRVVEPSASLRAPAGPTPAPPPLAQPPATARTLASAPPPMPAYQGRLYTAAPRPIAPPPASALPAHPGSAGHGPLPVVLVALGVVTFGILVLLVILYLRMADYI